MASSPHPLPPVCNPSLRLRKIVKATNATLSDETPTLLLFDVDMFRSNLREVRSSYPPNTLHTLAMKALPLASVLLVAQSEKFGVEVASPAELHHALSLGFHPSVIVFDSPAKTWSDLRFAMKAGVHINADSLQELARIDKLRKTDEDCRCSVSTFGVRINPQLGSGTIASTGTASLTSKFGVPLLSQSAELLELLSTSYDFVTVVHVHVGSQGVGLQMLLAGAAAAVDLAEKVNAKRGAKQIGGLDLGGGLPADYRTDDAAAAAAKPDDPERLTAALLVAELQKSLGDRLSGFRLFTEYGRHLVAKCGHALTTVEYVKKNVGPRTILTTQCGADLFLRTAYRPEDWPHRVSAWTNGGDFIESPPTTPPSSELPNNVGGGKDAPPPLFDVVGPLCFRGDVIAAGVTLDPDVKEGDRILVHDTGAYTLSMYSRYNSRRAPPTYGYWDDEGEKDGDKVLHVELFGEGETVDDALRLWRLPSDHTSPRWWGDEITNFVLDVLRMPAEDVLKLGGVGGAGAERRPSVAARDVAKFGSEQPTPTKDPVAMAREILSRLATSASAGAAAAAAAATSAGAAAGAAANSAMNTSNEKGVANEKVGRWSYGAGAGAAAAASNANADAPAEKV